MSEWKLPWEGGCRCGKTRIKATAPPLLTMACHCSGCQRMTASAFSLSIAIPAEGFEVTSGKTILGGLHGISHHHFCDYCLSWLFTKSEGLEFFVNVRATAFDDHLWVVPYAETGIEEKFPWAQTSAKHSFEKIPPNETFTKLIAEFMEHGARP